MGFQWHDTEFDFNARHGFENETISYLARSLANPTMGDEPWRACIKPDFFVIADPDNGGIQVSGRCDSIDEGKEIVGAILKIQNGIII